MTSKPPDRPRFYCMDCNNFRTRLCPRPYPKLLDDPAQFFCPNFDNHFGEHKPKQPRQTSTTPTITPPDPASTQTQLTLPLNRLCPKCHKPCSFQRRPVPNKKRTKTHLYWFAEHYDPAKDPPITWHYIGKKLPG